MTTAVLRDLFGRLQSGLGELLDDAAAAAPARARGALRRARAARPGAGDGRRDGLRRGPLAPGRRRAPVRAVGRADRHPRDEPLRPGRPQRALRRAPRGRPRPLRAPVGPGARRARGSARASRSGSTSPRAGCGRTSSGAAARSGCAGCRARRTCSPRCATTALDGFLRAVNAVRPSLIRAEADEFTYPLHVILRFELEVALIEGDLAVADVPAAWDEGMRRLLGVTVPDDRRGALQDIHWAFGELGYFPTYALGHDRGRAAVAGRARRPARPRRVARGGGDGAAARLAGRARPPPRPPAGARRAAAARHRLELRPRPAAGPPAGEARRAVTAAPLAPGHRPVTHATAAVWLAAHPCPFAPRTSRGPPAPRWRSSCSWPPRSPARPAPAAATAPDTA